MDQQETYVTSEELDNRLNEFLAQLKSEFDLEGRKEVELDYETSAQIAGYEQRTINLEDKFQETLSALRNIDRFASRLEFLKLLDDVDSIRRDTDQNTRRLTVVEERLTGIDRRLTAIESRLANIDERFAQIDERFTQIDERFTQIDERFTQIDERFAQIDERFAQMDGKLDVIVGMLRGSSGGE
ncbi:MAG: hypothetical protein F4X87_07775 [Chloroflexi bacterium]|nr:hypothetical protein [Chloroflexota bacterium]